MYLTTLDPISRDFDRDRPARVRRPCCSTALATRPALPMDTVRRDGELVLRFDVPGVDQDKIDVTVDKGVLTVSATREEATTEGENPVVRERLFGSFTRRVRLSDNLDADAIEASHHEGVLEIRIPVREEAKPRKITVAPRARPRSWPSNQVRRAARQAASAGEAHRWPLTISAGR